MRSGCDPVALEAAVPRCRAFAQLLRGARARVEDLHRARWWGPGARRSHAELALLGARLGLAAGRLDEIGRTLETQALAQRRASLGAPTRTVLRSDRQGDGRWVARVGASSARSTVVLVPGVGTTRADRAELDRDARRMWEELASRAERDGRGQDSVSAVAWLGYDPPDHLLGGLSRRPADRGGEQLALDVDRWRRDGATRVVVVGHSYGGVVAARASAAGMGADELVLLGAPGLGVTDPSQLRLRAGAELWSAAARGDAISVLARIGVVHGPDPVAHARALPTSTWGHGAYLEDPELLAALAELALHDPRPAGTVARIPT